MTASSKSLLTCRMPPSRMLRRVALIRADVSEEPGVSIFWVITIGELGTLAVTSNHSSPDEVNSLKRAS
jgi:hypothetical protein